MKILLSNDDGYQAPGIVALYEAIRDLGDVEVVAPGSLVRNPGFDVTPARLVTGIVTERGVAPASREGLAALYPEHARP